MVFMTLADARHYQTKTSDREILMIGETVQPDDTT
jgi:hypothetical protein